MCHYHQTQAWFGSSVVVRSKHMNLIWLSGLDNLDLTCLSDLKKYKFDIVTK